MVEGHRCIARDDLFLINTDVGLFTGQGHAAEGVAANQAGDCYISIEVFRISPCRTLRLAGIDIGLRLGFDGQRGPINDKGQISAVGFIIGDRIFRDNVFAAGVGQRTRQLQRAVGVRVGASDACFTRDRECAGRAGRKCFARSVAGHGISIIGIFRTAVGLSLRGAGNDSRQFRNPDRVEVFQRFVFVRGDLQCGIIGAIRTDEQRIGRGSRTGTCLSFGLIFSPCDLCPAAEDVAFAGRFRRNRHSLVDADIIIIPDFRAFAFSDTVEPPDVGRGLFFRRGVFRADPNGIGILRVLRCGAFSFYLQCIVFDDREGLARFHSHGSVFKCRTVPALDDPV